MYIELPSLQRNHFTILYYPQHIITKEISFISSRAENRQVEKIKTWNENDINPQCMRILGNGFIIRNVETCMNKDKKWNDYESEFHRIL